ncbi:MAG: DUF4157 domain-containing protein, partial [Pyrinomonadaceae bacterium]
ACAQCDEPVNAPHPTSSTEGGERDELQLMAKRGPTYGGDAGSRNDTSHTGVGQGMSVDGNARAGELVRGSGAGQPLGGEERAYFEPRLGYDLSGVRVHSGEEAARSAGGVDALAYTVGRDIVFGAGQYAPGTTAGKSLLAHELAHVIQQGQSRPIADMDGGGRHFNMQAQTESGIVARQAAAAPAAASRLNYDNLAERIHEAVEGGFFFGLGTDEEQVYLALQQLGRDAAAIRELERVYLSRYRVTLEAAIRGDFSGEELEYALQLINRGTPGAAQAIGATPTTSAQIEAAARRIRTAVEIWGTDEEAIYAVLLPFNRDMRLLHELMRVYESLYSQRLRERIISEMSGSELDYALYLLGGAAVRANVEITEVTDAEALRLFSEMASLGFWTTNDAQSPIPFHYPPDGCYARAHMMVQRMTELGYASEKVFAISTMPGGLNVHSGYAADVLQPPGVLVNDPLCAGVARGTQPDPLVTWWYHVAPVIRVRNAAGAVTEMVIDPSVAGGPLTIAQWTGLASAQPFTRLRVNEIEELLANNRGRYPSSSNLTFTADRDVFYPQGPFSGPNPEGAEGSMEAVRPRMTEYTRRAAAHELAAAIRREEQNAAINVTTLTGIIHNATPDARLRLRRCFPNLFIDLRGKLSPADATLIDAELNRP